MDATQRLQVTVEQVLRDPRTWNEFSAPAAIAWLKAAMNSAAIRRVVQNLTDGVPVSNSAENDFIAACLLFAARDRRDVELGMSALDHAISDQRLHVVVIDVAEALARHCDVQDDVEYRALVLTHLGTAWARVPYGSRVDNQLAGLHSLEKALRVATEYGDYSLRAMILNTVGSIFKERPGSGWEENHRLAIQFFRMAGASLEQAHSEELISAAEHADRRGKYANNLANALRDGFTRNETKHAAAVEEAISIYQEALGHRSSGAGRGKTLSNLAIAWLQRPTGDPHSNARQAMQCLEQARATYGERASEYDEAVILNTLATCHLRLASEQCGGATGGQEATQLRRRARAALEEAAQTFGRLGCRREQIAACYNLGQLERDTGELSAACRHFLNAAQLVDRHPGSDESPGARRAWLTQYGDILEQVSVCCAMLAREGGDSIEEARTPGELSVEWLERMVANSLRHLVTLRDQQLPTALQEKLGGYVSGLLALAASDDEAAHDSARPGSSADPERLLVRMAANRQNLFHDWRRSREEAGALITESTAIDVDELRSLAQSTASTLLLLRSTPQGTCVAGVFPSGSCETVLIESFTFSDLDALLSRLLRAGPPGGALHKIAPDAGRLGRQALIEALDELGSRFWSPLRDWLESRTSSKVGDGVGRVVIVPGPGFNVLPLHASRWMQDGRPKLACDDWIISYAPSLSVLRSCVARGGALRTCWPARMLAISNPTGDLPYAAWEVEHIAREFPGDVTELGGPGNGRRPATTASVGRLLPEHEIALFATHAEYDAMRPWTGSRILLAASGKKKRVGDSLRKVKLMEHELGSSTNPKESVVGNLDSVAPSAEALSLREVYAWDLSSNWLTFLSTCESAISDLRDPTCEQIGWPGAFVAAGATTCIGSLWKIHDASAALVNTRFFHELFDPDSGRPRTTKAKALWSSQRWLRTLPLESAQQILGARLDTNEPFPFADPYHWAAFVCYGAP